MYSKFIIRLLFSILLLPGVLVCLPSAASAAPAPKAIVIAMDNYPPYHYWENGVPTGLNIDLINEAFSRMNLEPQFVQMPWKRSLEAVEHGEITALCAGMKTQARTLFAFYPTRHLSLETNWVIVLTKNRDTVTALDDLSGKTIGAVRGYSYGAAFDNFPHITRSDHKNESALLGLLTNERIDFIVGCDLVINHVAKQQNLSHLIQYKLKLTSDPLYLIFSRAVSGNEKLSAAFSHTLSAMIEDGTHQRILEQYGIHISQ